MSTAAQVIDTANSIAELSGFRALAHNSHRLIYSLNHKGIVSSNPFRRKSNFHRKINGVIPYSN